MRVLVLLALVASCEGRCREIDAANDEVPGALCADTFDGKTALCLRGNELFTCNVHGMVWHDATCVRSGTVVP